VCIPVIIEDTSFYLQWGSWVAWWKWYWLAPKNKHSKFNTIKHVMVEYLTA